ncbi:FAS1 domain-containing protein [Dioszegia hungarica]|uniref:FAS1 domain-containing protein n=1 Tax=Dioszegia hungarica TaxID=4972 RepID=A0AA38HBG8_9TREE|nr:FAS1 domain-containing protein [Dioszegia hungarica]KAI9637353.1 FAS1 domain-containing protein [Dioszegia hungarica]
MRFSLSLLLPLLPLLLPTPALSQSTVDCDNADLTSYLLQLIDALYANGLTTFESLLADITSTDSGYDLLSTIFTQSDQTFTLLVPTDSAFQMAAVWAPFEHQSKDYLVDLFGLHTLQGHYGYNELPEAGMGVGRSMMRKREWEERVVMKRGERGMVVVKTAYGEVSSWSGPADISAQYLLDNLVILPIDHVLQAPPNISTALTLPSTTRSPNGLPLLQAAIANVSASGADALTEIKPGGLTFFAPVDDAWGKDAWAQVADKTLRAKLIGNHYTTNYSLFSPDWTSGTITDLTIMNGDKLKLSVEGDTSYVSLGDQKAQILRSDITLENGVLHIIDRVLVVPQSEKPNPFIQTLANSPTQAAKPSGSAPMPSSTGGASRLTGTKWSAVAAVAAWYLSGL